jgi:hypothetical protein
MLYLGIDQDKKGSEPILFGTIIAIYKKRPLAVFLFSPALLFW